ncbi:unnamed protein product, partial [Polarella glacialis]
MASSMGSTALGNSSVRAGPDSLASILWVVFKEFSDGDNGVPVSNFLHLLSHWHLMSWEFDHKRAVQVFVEAAGGIEEFLDQKTFRNALQALSVAIFGAQYGLKGNDGTLSPEGHRRTSRVVGDANSLMIAGRNSAMQDLGRVLSLGSESSFSLKSAPEATLRLYDFEVISAAYQYDDALRGLYSLYAVEAATTTEPTALNARSAYRLFRACRLVPECVVAGELHDVAAAFRSSYTSEQKYFQEERMLSRGE